MTREDPLYEPAPANTNPFASNAQLSAGRKVVASDVEREQLFELSTTLPHTPAKECIDENNNNNNIALPKQASTRYSHSLPGTSGLVQKAIAQFNSQITSSQNHRMLGKLSSSEYASEDSSATGSLTNSHRFVRKNSTLECAMLFYGLDLIQIHRASSSEWGDTYISTDLESEFQDDLEDVLRQSEEVTLSPTPDSAFGDLENEWWFSEEQADPTTCRYLHPTLIEKRKQLRRVESRQKEKIEQLHLKLEQLKITADETVKQSRKQANRR